MALPKELFGAKVNKKLMAQAVRVYLANQRAGSAITKTRGEVSGTTHKVWRQKGTGRARHGSRKAPIFVKGGVALGPRPKDFSLSLSKKMKRAALFSALSSKLQDGGIKVVLGLETLAPKTKLVANTLQSLGLMTKNKKVLLVLPFVQEKGLPAGRQGKSNTENILKAARNIEGISMFPANQLNTYTILASRTVLFMEDAIESMEKHFIKEE